MILHNVFVNSVWGKRYIKTGSVKKPKFVSKGESRRRFEKMQAHSLNESQSQSQSQMGDESGEDTASSDSKELVVGSHSESRGDALVVVPDDISELVIESNVDTVFAEIGVNNDVFTKNDPLLIENEEQEQRLGALYWLDIVEMILLAMFLPLYLGWGNMTLPYGMMLPVHVMVFTGLLFTYFFVGRTMSFETLTPEYEAWKHQKLE